MWGRGLHYKPIETTAKKLSVSCYIIPSTIHRKKRFTSFPSPAGMSLTKLPLGLGRNNSVMTSLFPPRESLVVTFRLGTGNSRSFFLRCRTPQDMFNIPQYFHQCSHVWGHFMCMQKTSRRKCFSLRNICNSAAWQWAVPANVGRVSQKSNSAHAAMQLDSAHGTHRDVFLFQQCNHTSGILSLNLQVTILTPVHL